MISKRSPLARGASNAERLFQPNVEQPLAVPALFLLCLLAPSGGGCNDRWRLA
jgi:hypothetical protein